MTNIGNYAYTYSGSSNKFNAAFFYIYLRDVYTNSGTTYTEMVTVTGMSVSNFYGGYNSVYSGRLFYLTYPSGS
jgi:hypothetical protein